MLPTLFGVEAPSRYCFWDTILVTRSDPFRSLPSLSTVIAGDEPNAPQQISVPTPIAYRYLIPAIRFRRMGHPFRHHNVRPVFGSCDHPILKSEYDRVKADPNVLKPVRYGAVE